MGHGLIIEECVDWEAAVEALQRVRESIFVPKGITLGGCLRAVGEDDAELASVTINASGIKVERLSKDGDDGDGAATWIAALRSPDPDLREHAAMQLGGYDASIATAPLMNAIKTDSGERVRCKALESIGDLGHDAAAAVEHVVLCLSDESPFVRYWATYALGRLGPTAARVLPELEKMTNDSADGPRYGAIDAIRRIRAL